MITPPKSSYPLSWPDGWQRTKFRERSRFDTSMADACEKLQNELRMLGGSKVIISSNVEVRLDGLPYSNRKAPTDTGVAVYFTRKGIPTVMACDRWNRVECNLWAIVKHIESIRGQARWGVGSVDQAFRGYAQIPERTGGVSWWDVLGVAINAPEEIVKEAYRTKAMAAHPDRGGSDAEMARINEAYRCATSQKVAGNGTL